MATYSTCPSLPCREVFCREVTKMPTKTALSGPARDSARTPASSICATDPTWRPPIAGTATSGPTVRSGPIHIDLCISPCCT